MKLTNKEKQLLILAITYYSAYFSIDKKPHKDILRLDRSLYKIYLKLDDDEIEKQHGYAREFIKKIVNNDDIKINCVLLATSFAFVFAESKNIDIKLSNKLKKDCKKIFDSYKDKESLAIENAENICNKFTQSLAKEMPKKHYIAVDNNGKAFEFLDKPKRCDSVWSGSSLGEISEEYMIEKIGKKITWLDNAIEIR